MTALARPRGPLPPRVYWARRAALLVSALMLVYGIAHLLGAGGGAAPDPAGRTVGSVETPHRSTVGSPHPGAVTKSSHHPSRSAKPHQTATPLAVPSGPCAAADLVVTPSVKGTAYAGHTVAFRLSVTSSQPACTWNVSARSLVVKLTSGSDRIWSTQDCAKTIPPRQVVVRSGRFTTVWVKWDGQRSDGTCSRTTPWALPGYYHVQAAALGANPVDHQFRLYRPLAPTITPKPKPKKHHSPSASSSPSPKASTGAH